MMMETVDKMFSSFHISNRARLFVRFCTTVDKIDRLRGAIRADERRTHPELDGLYRKADEMVRQLKRLDLYLEMA